MIFRETELPGAFIVTLEPASDERGDFSRTFCEREFAAHGLPTRFPQHNLSRNRKRGTLRGMHYSDEAAGESKLVRCTSGAIFDVIVDIRPGSKAFGRWCGVDLTRENGTALFIPAGVAHGFLTTADETEVVYQMGDFFRPGTGRGFRWNDPAFSIAWPFEPSVIAERDATYPDFTGK